MAKSNGGTMVTIDEALEQTHFGKFNYLVIVFSGMILKNVVLESVGISFALPVLQHDLGLTYQQQGILGAVSFIGIIISSHMWGFLADTTGRKRIMQPALLTGYAITLFSTFSPNFETLAVLRFLSGIFLSAGSATVFAYLGEFHQQKYRSRAILSGAFISAFLAIFFPALAWGLINQTWEYDIPWIDITFNPWRSYMLACGTLGLICGLMLFFLPESPKYLMSVGRTDEAIAVMKRIHDINIKWKKRYRNSTFNVTGLIPDSDTSIKPIEISSKNFVVTLLKLMWQQTAPLFMREHVRKTVLVSVMQFIIFYSAHGVYMWFPYILNSLMQFTKVDSTPMLMCDILRVTQSNNFTLANEESTMHLENETYEYTIILEVIYVVLLLCVSYIIAKVGRILIYFITLLVCGACGILALLVEIQIVAIYSFSIMLCCGLAITVLNSIVVDIYPTNLRAMAVCISLMLGRIGSVAGSNVLGTFIDVDCEAVLYSSSAGLILAGLMGFLLPKLKTPNEKNNS